MHGLTAATTNTITDRGTLNDELAQIRETGIRESSFGDLICLVFYE
ncbi:IclR family transcriptional regulator C-terminal domain-containing protein [Halocatena marina]|uniref:IclR family transcriptional regulator C-terminal domain-containing protein n=1 Tax=Halocatena marina TaxID=2934937 RepID=A0ABD5YSS0_9EURY|nr:IclR family transcriptional regulator C-terminal domain-containing protein [Halocatena marina]